MTDTINKVATGGTIDFLPCKDIRIWHVDIPYRGDTVVEWVYQKITGSTTVSDYRISVDAVRIFYPIKKEAIDQYFVENAGSFEASEYPKLPPTDKASFTPILDKFFLMPYFTFFKIIAIAIYVITIGRCFELCIYTLLAPLPLATFASDVSHDVGRNFLPGLIKLPHPITQPKAIAQTCIGERERFKVAEEACSFWLFIVSSFFLRYFGIC